MALSAGARSAWEASFLGELPADLAAGLLDGAAEVELPAGQVVERGLLHGEPLVLALVAEGLLRIYWTSLQGRQVTARYVGPGDVLGVPFVIARGGAPVAVQALTACRALRLAPERLSALAAADARVGWAVARYLAELVFETQSLLTENVFLTVRQRVARHLLDLAERDGGRLVVRASQQDVANAIGSVREVVSRVLQAFRTEGLVSRDGSVEVIHDPAALHRAVTGREDESHSAGRRHLV